jgi:hypothetical protein
MFQSVITTSQVWAAVKRKFMAGTDYCNLKEPEKPERPLETIPIPVRGLVVFPTLACSPV